MSSKNKGTDQLRGYSKGGLHISFRTYKKGFTISLYTLGGWGGGRRLHLFGYRGGLAQWLASRTTDQGVPGSRPGRGTVCCGLKQVTFTHCLVLVKPRKPWTDD